MKSKISIMLVTLLVVLSLVLAGCNVTTSSLTNPASNGANSSAPISQDGNSSAISQANAEGKLEIRVTDAPAKENITSIMVKVKTIEVHQAGPDEDQPEETAQTEGAQQTPNESEDSKGWKTIDVSKSAAFDLLKVKDNPQTLTTMVSAVGNYTQIRLEVESVLVTFSENGQTHTEKATVPGGKIKFNHAFNINPNNITQLLFDFDAAQSVHVTGNGKVMFKPVIKLNVSKTEDKEQQKQETATPQQFRITTDKLADGTVGSQYTGSLAATNGTAPYKWSVTAGALPAGLALNADTGALTGTPTVDGNFTFTVKVNDSSAQVKSATRNFTLKIKVSDLQITTNALPLGAINTPYSVTLVATGGVQPYHWIIDPLALPAGLTLNANTGVLAGTPTVSGEFNITVQVTDSSTPVFLSDTQALVINISPAP